MDTELIRTFLEVNRTRHFSRAAERLSVTPAAVSARIRLLEDQLGTPLFVRGRNNIRLTPAGRRLLPHAENLLRSWNRARLSVGGSGEDQELVALGSVHSIWQALLEGWLPRARDDLADVVLQVELLTTDVLVTRVREQSLDFALVYEPPRVIDLRAEAVAAVELLLVSDRPGQRADGSLHGYVQVDWGSPFAMTLARTAPDLPDPVLRVDSPDLAREFLASRGGAAYLPSLDMAGGLGDPRLFGVDGAPVIERPVYLIGHADTPEAGVRSRVRDNLLDWLARARTGSVPATIR